jgi:hypothetical protein
LVHWSGATRAFDRVVIPVLVCMFLGQTPIELLSGKVLTVEHQFLTIVP